MNIKLRIEGTPEELTPVFQALQTIKPKTTASPETDMQVKASEMSYISPDFLRKALERYPLSEYTLALLRAFVEDEENAFHSTDSLFERVKSITGRQKLTKVQFNGVFGSLGRRIYQTKGYDGTSSYSEGLEVNGQMHYRLPAALREVVREFLSI
ncbi:MAG: hypothetical protein F4X14_11455 [Caldilineaceae bacterium SB0661_bin_32]|uniref:Uncharacterized protein n=1 Tax=Caldilineaceae bacterium SB0661_bin_32 TaxID=2605255 RepID=A0A6B1D7M6_9CHLR|nr:hypothetical protein [Caldilineaceae bacterium SB0661_bin_32]